MSWPLFQLSLCIQVQVHECLLFIVCHRALCISSVLTRSKYRICISQHRCMECAKGNHLSMVISCQNVGKTVINNCTNDYLIRTFITKDMYISVGNHTWYVFLFFVCCCWFFFFLVFFFKLSLLILFSIEINWSE